MSAERGRRWLRTPLVPHAPRHELHANAEHWHDKQLDLAPRKDQDDRYDERVSPRRKASRK
ncbi:hypothetical protein GE543_14780 [Pseudomonas sp. SZ57]|nr:hypothetical protein [Pseudomonas sp. SZ57]